VVDGIRLVWLFAKLGILDELAYRRNLAAQVVSSAIGLVGSLALLAAIFARTTTLAGWSPAELVALLGVFYLLTGLLRTFVLPSLQLFLEEVRLGTFDVTLTKPADAQVLASTKRVEVWRLVDVGMGAILLIGALTRIEPRVAPGPAVAFLVALVAGGSTVYSLVLILATLVFWFVRVDNVLVVFLTFWEAGRWPVQVYPPWLRGTLTVLVPVALATTVPAEAIAGKLAPTNLLGAMAVAGALPAISRWIWRRGVRRYSGASS
jgi:ABC-2 type transport system permease protein